MKNRYLIYIALLILTLSITLGVTYSYLAAKINNRESSSTIKVESGQLSITYENNSSNIILNNIIPGDSVTKQFTLTGINNTKPNAITTNTDLKYKIGIVIDNNTFSEGALTYSLTKDSTSSSNGKTADDSTGTIKSSGIQYIGKGYFVSGANNDKHIYNLTISFPDTNEDQSIDQGASFACHVTIKHNYVPQPKSFAEDTWETIAENTSSDVYNVGDTRQVLIGNKPYTVRIANKSTPAECNDNDLNFSQTACGFVVEFADIVEDRQMNSTDTNVGGWEASEMRTYANGAFFNNLPEDLRNVIIDTKVVSGHGFNDANPNREDGNWESTDKLYLLSTHEVYEDGTSNQVSSRDTAWDKTRQLDYYANLKVTTNSYSDAKKKDINGNVSLWWLRSAGLNGHNYFIGVLSSGDHYGSAATNNIGFAPAFRIGDKENTVTPKSFAEDTWETIAKNTSSDVYKVGDTRQVLIGNKPYTVRIANKSTPTECNDSNFSQTACGFVVEFADIVENRQMNSTNTNVGGWKGSAMRTYLNGDTDDHMTYNDTTNGPTATFFSKLPKELRDVIENTKVVSGHGSTTGETNFTSTDKIYLLSSHEVWEDGTSGQVSSKDTAYNQTRRLDYYKNLGVTTSSYSGAKKKYNNSNSRWWLCAANFGSDSGFLTVYSSGYWYGNSASGANGLAPAFRIGEKM